MAETNIHLDCMIIEAGICANSLSSSSAGSILATKIKLAADAAWAQQKPDVVLDLDPFESGMLLDGLASSQSSVTGDLINRIFNLLNTMMMNLGITALPPVPQPADPNADQGNGEQPANDGEPAADSQTPPDSESEPEAPAAPEPPAESDSEAT